MKRSIQFLAICAGLVASSAAAHEKEIEGYDVTAVVPSQAIQASLKDAAAKAGGSISSVDTRLGVPTFMWATGSHPVPAQVRKPEGSGCRRATVRARRLGRTAPVRGSEDMNAAEP